MTKASQSVLRILLITGAMEIGLGVLHFFMPAFLSEAPGINRLSSVELDFVVLVTYCVGILLIAFGVLNLFLVRRAASSSELLSGYCGIKAALFGARSALEFVYPVGLGLFWIEPFTLVATPGVLLVFGLYVAALWLARRA